MVHLGENLMYTCQREIYLMHCTLQRCVYTKQCFKELFGGILDVGKAHLNVFHTLFKHHFTPLEEKCDPPFSLARAIRVFVEKKLCEG